MLFLVVWYCIVQQTYHLIEFCTYTGTSVHRVHQFACKTPTWYSGYRNPTWYGTYTGRSYQKYFFLPTQILVQRGTMVTFFIFFMLHFAWYTMVGYSAHAMFMQTLCKMHILPLFRSCMVHYAGTIVYHYKIMAIVTATFTIHQVGLEGLRILPSLTYLCSVYTADSSRVIFIMAV